MEATDSPVRTAVERPPQTLALCPCGPRPLPEEEAMVPSSVSKESEEKHARPSGPYPVFVTNGYAKSEPDAHVRVVLGVDGVDESDQVRVRHHDEAMGPDPVTEEAHPLEQAAVGHTRGRDGPVPARSEVVREVDLLQARDPHLLEALRVGRLGEHEFALDLSVQAAHGGGGQAALGRPPRAHDRVDARPD